MNVFEVGAKIGLDTSSFDKGLANASKETSSFASKTKDLLGGVAKAATAAIGAAATGIGAVIKQSVTAYADYEQLVGGVETLFGDSAKKVIADAEEAYKTAGMSMNDYMETSIQSAASLINSLGGDQEKAAELMNMSIVDMSDNVNKMGTTMEAVQNAYRGFSRGNFTMLDNLALGFAGTKEGMQELLDKAEELSGVKYDISSYSDIVQAIHEVQTAMGITNTTKEEAEGTISGSINAAKSAWKNFVVEFSKSDGDIEKSFTRLSDSIEIVFHNIAPRAERALSSLGDIIVKASPRIVESIKEVLPKIMPTLVKSATSLVGSLGKGIISAIPDLLSASKGVFSDMYDSFSGADLGVFEWLKDDVDRVVSSVKGTIKGIDFTAIKDSLKGFESVFKNVGDALGWFTEDVLSPLVTWAANDILPDAITTLSGTIDILAAALGALKGPVWDNIIKPLAEGAGDVIAGTLDLISKAVGGLAEELDGVDWSGYWEDIQNGEFFADWKSGWEEIEKWFDEHDKDIEEFFDVSEVGTAWREFWEGIGEDVYDAQERWTMAFELLKTAVSNFADAWKLGAQTISDAFDTVKKKFDGFIEAWKTGWKTLTGAGGDVHDKTQNTIGGKILDKIIANIPAFGDGAYVTSPTLAVIGEKEPEYVVPKSKMNDTRSNVNIEKIEFTINGAFDMGSPQDRERLIEEMSSRLQTLSISQQRALGGAGWQ